MHFSTGLLRLMGGITRSPNKPTAEVPCNEWDIELQDLTGTAMEDTKSETSDTSQSMHRIGKVSPHCDLAGYQSLKNQ